MAVLLLAWLVQIHIGLTAAGSHSPGPGGVSAAGSPRDTPGRYEWGALAGQVDRDQSPIPPAALRRSSSSSSFSSSLGHAELPSPIWAFLHTGDPSHLHRANCTKRYQLAGSGSHLPLLGVQDTMVHASNFLNMILQTNALRETTVKEDIEWYHALVRSLVEGDPKVHRAVVAFNTQPFASPPQMLLQATRVGNQIFLQDLSSAAHRRLSNATAESDWFHRLKSQRSPASFLYRKLVNDNPRSNVRRRGERYLGDKTHIRWSPPFLECERGKYNPRWLLTLSTSFYGLNPDFKPEFRGVIRVDVDLQSADIDQCSTEGWFGGTHKCRLNSTECISPKGRGFLLGSYNCLCKTGFYRPTDVSPKGLDGDDEEDTNVQGKHGGLYECLACRKGCTLCEDDSPCYAEDDKYLRTTIIMFQAFCMLTDFIAMLVVYHFRRCKTIRASGLVLLETILFGALLLYFPVVILYFEPSIFRCILLRWVRLLGFATVYGTVTLKLYRVLKVFLSRTAQRIPYMTSWRVVRMLGIILLIVCWFLISWTSAVCENLDRNVPLIAQGWTADGLQFNMCLLDRWDYMMAIAEFLFLLWGVYLCYAVRTVPSAFHEPRYMAVAVHNELILSAVFHTIRFMLVSSLHGDWMLMLFFAHTHLTVTVTLGFLLIPKFLHAGMSPRDDIATEAYEDELDMGRSGSYLNSSITSAWSEHSLDPDDIRDELKKLYAQLEIYKRKKMTANNPHLQKKRSSKKGLGRSIMRRITEIPETVSRQYSREDKEQTDPTVPRNSISTCRKNPFDPASSSLKAKEDSLKKKGLTLQRSLSTYDHVRDKVEDSNMSAPDKMETSSTEVGLLDSLIGNHLGKKTNEMVDSVSTESVLLVCKSASAHNLSLDKKPLHPRTSMLQKSLSVIASAKEKTLGITGKAQSLEEHSKHHKGQQKVRDTNKGHSQSDSNEMGTSQPKSSVSYSSIHEEARKAPKVGIMKQHASSQSTVSPDSANSLQNDPFNRADVCPWEIQDQPPTPSETKVQKHVSIAPVESQNIHSSHSNAKVQSANKHKAAESVAKQKQVSQGSADRSEVCPWDTEEVQAAPSVIHQPESLQTSQDGDSNNGANFTEEMPSKAGVEASDMGRIGKGEVKRRGSSGNRKDKGVMSEPVATGNITHQSSVNRVDVCPWDYAPPDSMEMEKSPASTASAALLSSIPQKKTTVKGFGLSVKTLVSAGKAKDSESIKERKDDNKVKVKGKYKEKDKDNKGKAAEIPASKAKAAERYSWEVFVTPGSVDGRIKDMTTCASETENYKPAEVCPWEAVTTIPTSHAVERSTAAVKDNANVHSTAVDKSKMASICPWDFDDQTSGNNV